MYNTLTENIQGAADILDNGLINFKLDTN